MKKGILGKIDHDKKTIMIDDKVYRFSNKTQVFYVLSNEEKS